MRGRGERYGGHPPRVGQKLFNTTNIRSSSKGNPKKKLEGQCPSGSKQRGYPHQKKDRPPIGYIPHFSWAKPASDQESGAKLMWTYELKKWLQVINPQLVGLLAWMGPTFARVFWLQGSFASGNGPEEANSLHGFPKSPVAEYMAFQVINPSIGAG